MHALLAVEPNMVEAVKNTIQKHCRGTVLTDEPSKAHPKLRAIWYYGGTVPSSEFIMGLHFGLMLGGKVSR